MTPEIHLHSLMKWGALFGFGALCMRSAGCIFNDICDARIDAQVERTMGRPLAAGLLTQRHAIMALTFFLCGGLIVWWFLSDLGKLLSLVALGLLFLYPYTKRFFVFPQLILGFAFNAGILIAVAEIKPELLYGPQPWILYGIGIFWTLYYDTIYATQDMQDDLILGIHSTAVFFKNHLKLALTSFYLGMTSLMAILGLYLKGDIWFYMTLVFAVVYDIGVEIRQFSPGTRQLKSAYHLFINALLMGGAILFLILFPD